MEVLTSEETVIAKKMLKKCELNVYVWTVQRMLHKNEFKCSKTKKKIPLMKESKETRQEISKRPYQLQKGSIYW